ncbi:MAG: hypothetical protein COV67_08305 [Nitrospinae bacterium CG11_big_fil_rev_8_21_14_0_20_56_8]|nr:MAG: hypothetical protein COV67_08305 [Nitrospinae bacterium CG11_big_fil_rev_8_21_14_0_20_56_8]
MNLLASCFSAAVNEVAFCGNPIMQIGIGGAVDIVAAGGGADIRNAVRDCAVGAADKIVIHGQRIEGAESPWIGIHDGPESFEPGGGDKGAAGVIVSSGRKGTSWINAETKRGGLGLSAEIQQPAGQRFRKDIVPLRRGQLIVIFQPHSANASIRQIAGDESFQGCFHDKLCELIGQDLAFGITFSGQKFGKNFNGIVFWV